MLNKSLRAFTPFVVFIGFFITNSTGQPGTPDQKFGVNGKVTTDFTQGYDYGRAVTANSAGDIFITGESNDNIVTIKYKSTGKIDSTFGTEGKVIDNFLYYKSQANAILLQPDGKILIGGGYSDNIAGTFFGIIRYKPNGKLDSSFGTNGKATYVPGPNGIGYSLALLSDGKILMGGLLSGIIVLTRYKSNGTIDSSFGTNGTSRVTGMIGGSGPLSIATQVDHKIVVATTIDSDMGVMRFNEDGSLDNTFADNGLKHVLKDFAGASSVIIQPDKKIVVGGIKGYPVPDFAIVRLKSNGEFDSSFGTNGVTITDFTYQSVSFSSARQTDGKLLLAGYTLSATAQNNFVVVRYKTNGVVDSSFGVNGISSIDFNVGNDYLSSMVLQFDQKILLAGFTTPLFSYSPDFALARLNNDNILPITLASFTAIKKQSSVLLNWQTSSEQDNAYFAIERSNNGPNKFNEIGRVKSKGNSTQLQQYSFEDARPLNGNNFYRLRQVDRDGKISYSKTLFVDFGEATAIKLYPNPAKDIITLEGLNANSKTTISIVDLQSRILVNATVSNSSYTCNTKQFPAGTYYVRIEADKNVIILKFVKE